MSTVQTKQLTEQCDLWEPSYSCFLTDVLDILIIKLSCVPADAHFCMMIMGRDLESNLSHSNLFSLLPFIFRVIIRVK